MSDHCYGMCSYIPRLRGVQTVCCPVLSSAPRVCEYKTSIELLCMAATACYVIPYAPYFFSLILSFPQLHMHTADRVSAAKSKYPLHGRNNKLLHSTSRRRRVSPPRVAALHVCNMRTRRLSICFLNKILSPKKRKILQKRKKWERAIPGILGHAIERLLTMMLNLPAPVRWCRWRV